jgi:hypothetical protein
MIAGMSPEHCFEHNHQSRGLGSDDFPKDRIIDTKVFVTDAVADTLDLRPRLCRKVGKPLVRNLPYCL